MTLSHYELVGADTDRRFSPYCWRSRLALLHKGLEFRTIPWRFTEKAAIAFAQTDKVPVLVDADHVVADSVKIALDLEERYPDAPSLFGGESGRALSQFVTEWIDSQVTPAIFRMVVVDIPQHLAENDIAYFRETREARVGMSLEEFCADRADRLDPFRALLTPLRRTLQKQPFLHGAAPAWADYVAFAPFQWARCVSSWRILAEDDPLQAWLVRMLGLYGGDAGRVPAFY